MTFSAPMSSPLAVTYSALSTLVLVASVANACTEFVMGSEDGSITVGRTADIFGRADSDFVTHPRGQRLTSTIADGSEGMEWTVRNPYLGIRFLGLPLSAEGLNVNGLACSILMLGDSKYPTPSEENRTNAQAINQFNLCDWALSSFDNVSQVNQSLHNGEVIVTEISIADLQNLLPGSSRISAATKDATITSGFPMGYHYSLHDRSGASLIVEYTDEGLKTYNNTIGVLTNDPAYNYQKETLEQFLTLRNADPVSVFSSVKPRNNPVAITAQGMDVNMAGLPGDYSSNSRFLRTAVNLNTLVFPTTIAEAINAAKYILGSIEVFAGAIYMVPSNKGAEPDQTWTTIWATIRDVEHGVYYFHSYNNPEWKQIDLNDLDFTEGAPSLTVDVDLPQRSSTSRPLVCSIYVLSHTTWLSHGGPSWRSTIRIGFAGICSDVLLAPMTAPQTTSMNPVYPRAVLTILQVYMTAFQSCW